MYAPPKGQCKTICPDGSFPIHELYQCIKCHQSSFSPYSCATCTAGTNADCQSCNAGSYLYSNGSCIYPCPKGYWGRESPRECVLCHERCATCTHGSASNQCTSCDPPYYLHEGECRDECPPGYWGNSNSTCQKCWTSDVFPFSCETCTGGGNAECKTCNSDYFLHPNIGGQCLNSCPDGYWKDSSEKKCQPCWTSDSEPYYSCSTCSAGESDKCLTCYSGKFLYSGQCLSSCSSRFWGDSSSNTCEPCWKNSSNIAPFSCLTCDSPSSSSCVTCEPGFFLYPSPRGQCLQICPDGYWPNDSSGTCDACWVNPELDTDPHSCKTCASGSESNQCTSCAPGTFLHPNTGGQCLSHCPDGFWEDTYNRACQSCWSSDVSPYSCATCNGHNNTNCLTCKPDTFLYEGQCISPCPDGFWGDNSTLRCLPCNTDPIPCKTCDAGTSSNCTSCYIGIFLSPMNYGSCLEVCPDGSYADNSDWKCKPCYSSGVVNKSACWTCTGPLATNCKTCSAPGTYYSPVDNSCVTTCPDGYYPKDSEYPDNQCEKCYQYNPPTNLGGTCTTCSGPDSNQCLSCNSTQFFDSTTSTCVNSCPVGYWGNSSSSKCELCYQAPSETDPSQSCETCTGPESTNCASCSSGSFYHPPNNSCLLNCPSVGYWEDSSSNQCKPCYEYTAASSTNNTCVTCSGSNSDNCLSCNSTTFLDSTTNRCVNICPDGYYGDTSENLCKPCYEAPSPSDDTLKSCKTCSGPAASDCQSCNSGTYLYSGNNTCLAECPEGWYRDETANTCNRCYQNLPPSTWGSCATCTGPLHNNCQSCVDYFYNPAANTCESPCSAGTYPVPATKQCAPCFQTSSSNPNDPQSCFTCNGPLSTNCLSCPSGFYYSPKQSSCVTTCPTGSYQNVTDMCDSCYVSTSNSSSGSCASCNGPNPTNCTGCSAGYYLDNQTSSCVATCPNGTYADNQTWICQPCFSAQAGNANFSCETCDGPLATQCLSCAAGLALITTSGTCSDTCPCEKGYYYDSTSRVCGLCHSSCSYCAGPTASDCKLDTDAEGYCLANGFLVNNNPGALATGVVALGSSQFTTAISVTTNILSGGITLGASTVVSVLGLLGLYQYLNVDYPSHVVTFFRHVFAGNPLNFPNLFVLAANPDPKLLDEDSTIQGSNKFNTFQVSNLFLVNAGPDIALLICLLSTVPLIAWIYSLLKKKKPNSKLRKFVLGIKKLLMWNFILSTFMSSFITILLSACLQYRYPNTTSTKNGFGIFSILICAVVTVGYLAFMGLVIYVSRKENLSSVKEDMYENVRVLVNDEEEEPSSSTYSSVSTAAFCTEKDINKSMKGRYWALVLCSRNLVLVPIIAVLSDAPIVQCTLSVLINLAFFVVVTIWKFFTSKTKRITMRICDGLNAVIPFLFLLYAINDSQSHSSESESGFLSDAGKNVIGWAIIVLVCIVMSLNLLFTVCDTWFILWQLNHILFKCLKKSIIKLRPSQGSLPPMQNHKESSIDLAVDQGNESQISTLREKNSHRELLSNRNGDIMEISNLDNGDSVIGASIIQPNMTFSMDKETIMPEEVKENLNLLRNANAKRASRFSMKAVKDRPPKLVDLESESQVSAHRDRPPHRELLSNRGEDSIFIPNSDQHLLPNHNSSMNPRNAIQGNLTMQPNLAIQIEKETILPGEIQHDSSHNIKSTRNSHPPTQYNQLSPKSLSDPKKESQISEVIEKHSEQEGIPKGGSEIKGILNQDGISMPTKDLSVNLNNTVQESSPFKPNLAVSNQESRLLAGGVKKELGRESKPLYTRPLQYPDVSYFSRSKRKIVRKDSSKKK